VPERNKLVKRIYPRLSTPTPSTTINVRVGASDLPQGPYTYTPAKLFTSGTDRWLDFTNQGRYLSIEFSSNSSEVWTLTGFNVEYRESSWF